MKKSHLWTIFSVGALFVVTQADLPGNFSSPQPPSANTSLPSRTSTTLFEEVIVNKSDEASRIERLFKDAFISDQWLGGGDNSPSRSSEMMMSAEEPPDIQPGGEDDKLLTLAERVVTTPTNTKEGKNPSRKVGELTKLIDSPVAELQNSDVDNSQQEVEKLVQAVGDNYKYLKDLNTDQRIVVAYGLDHKAPKESVEEELIRKETEKLDKQLELVKTLAADVKETADVVNQKRKSSSNSYTVLQNILQYSKALLAKNRPEIKISVDDGDEYVQDDDPYNYEYTEHDTMRSGGRRHRGRGRSWTRWTSWSDCTMSCGTHSFKYRHRKCLVDEQHCEGNSKDTQACTNLPVCGPIAGGWQAWSAWSACSVTCGTGGRRMRFRDCGLANGCIGDDEESAECKRLAPCRPVVESYWSVWSDWAACTVTCGSGLRARTRDCIKLVPEAAHCADKGVETEQCATPCSGGKADGGYKDGYEEGFWEGHEGKDRDGYRKGYEEGFYEGKDRDGYRKGYEEGFWEGHEGKDRDGYRKGYEGGERGGYRDGDEGRDEGDFKEGYEESYREGHIDTLMPGELREGHAEGLSTDEYREGGHSDRYGDENGRPGDYNEQPMSSVHDLNSAIEEQEPNQDGLWSQWTEWSACSVTCGVGMELRDRTCKGTCYGNTQLRRPCVKATCELSNVGFAERLLEGDSAELDCPIYGLKDEEIIWIAPDGNTIDKNSNDERFQLTGKVLQITGAKVSSAGTYHCIATHTASGNIRSGDVSLTVTTCAASPCKHGGTCEEKTNEEVPWLAFTCTCPPDTVGTFCELRLTDNSRFWMITCVISGCFLLCLICTIMAVSWKEMRAKYDRHPFNLAKYFTDKWKTMRGMYNAKSTAKKEEAKVVELDVSKPEGDGYLAKFFRLFKRTKKHHRHNKKHHQDHRSKRQHYKKAMHMKKAKKKMGIPAPYHHQFTADSSQQLTTWHPLSKLHEAHIPEVPPSLHVSEELVMDTEEQASTPVSSTYAGGLAALLEQRPSLTAPHGMESSIKAPATDISTIAEGTEYAMNTANGDNATAAMSPSGDPVEGSEDEEGEDNADNSITYDDEEEEDNGDSDD